MNAKLATLHWPLALLTLTALAVLTALAYFAIDHWLAAMPLISDFGSPTSDFGLRTSDFGLPSAFAPCLLALAPTALVEDQINEFSTVLGEIKGNWAEIKNLPVTSKTLQEDNVHLIQPSKSPNCAALSSRACRSWRHGRRAA